MTNTKKIKVKRSVDSKDRVETSRRTDATFVLPSRLTRLVKLECETGMRDGSELCFLLQRYSLQHGSAKYEKSRKTESKTMLSLLTC